MPDTCCVLLLFRACCHIVEKEAPQGHPVVAGEAGGVDHSRICSSRNIAMIGGEGGAEPGSGLSCSSLDGFFYVPS